VTAPVVAAADAPPPSSPPSDDLAARWKRRRDGRMLTWRGAGAFVVWSTLQSLFLLPSPAAPFLAPRMGALLNVGVVLAAWAWLVARAVRAAAAEGRADATATGGWRSRRARFRAATLRLRRAPGALPWLALAAAATALATAGLVVLTARVLPFPKDNPLEAYLRLPDAALAVLVVGVGVAPLLEELFFRGWLQRTLERRLPAWLAIALAAVIFSLAHAEAFGFGLRALLGVASGYAAWRTRSIWPSVALHAAYNGMVLLGSAVLGGVVDEARIAAFARTAAGLGAGLAAAAAGGAAAAWALARLGDAVRARRVSLTDARR
jgi:membrane protease YdiL (CAAX protease family)